MKDTPRSGLKGKILLSVLVIGLLAGFLFVWRIEPPVQKTEVAVGQSVPTPHTPAVTSGGMQPILRPIGQ
jgi:hypothetical protein